VPINRPISSAVSSAGPTRRGSVERSIPASASIIST
jgi:hypothetical protein